MALYNLYAGLKNKNWNMEVRHQKFKTFEEAIDAARELAVKMYQFYSGYYWEDCWDELNGDSSTLLYTDEEVDDYYYDTINREMSYHVVCIEQ